jgi:CheY-like chemotaxis protein
MDGLHSKKAKILIVDDDENVRSLVESILGSDYIVVKASNGREANRIACRQKPDLILLDVIMPSMDGLLTCGQLKANPETQQIPIVMISGIDSESHKFLASASGSSGFVRKPFTSEQLLAAVRKFIAD